MGLEPIKLRSVGYIIMKVELWYAEMEWIRIEKKMEKNE